MTSAGGGWAQGVEGVAADGLQVRVRRGPWSEQFSGLDLPSVCKDGRRLHTSVSLALMRGADDVPGSTLLVIEDYTERRANMIRLARLTRLYEVLGAVTEAIPEVREPERLYQEVCRIAVEQGGFQLAWVGRRRSGAPVQAFAPDRTGSSTLS